MRTKEEIEDQLNHRFSNSEYDLLRIICELLLDIRMLVSDKKRTNEPKRVGTNN